jgi:hypothetical protein
MHVAIRDGGTLHTQSLLQAQIVRDVPFCGRGRAVRVPGSSTMTAVRPCGQPASPRPPLGQSESWLAQVSAAAMPRRRGRDRPRAQLQIARAKVRACQRLGAEGRLGPATLPLRTLLARTPACAPCARASREGAAKMPGSTTALDSQVLGQPIEDLGPQPADIATVILVFARKPTRDHKAQQEPTWPARNPRDVVSR